MVPNKPPRVYFHRSWASILCLCAWHLDLLPDTFCGNWTFFCCFSWLFPGNSVDLVASPDERWRRFSAVQRQPRVLLGVLCGSRRHRTELVSQHSARRLDMLYRIWNRSLNICTAHKLFECCKISMQMCDRLSVWTLGRTTVGGDFTISGLNVASQLDIPVHGRVCVKNTLQVTDKHQKTTNKFCVALSQGDEKKNRENLTKRKFDKDSGVWMSAFLLQGNYGPLHKSVWFFETVRRHWHLPVAKRQKLCSGKIKVGIVE